MLFSTPTPVFLLSLRLCKCSYLSLHTCPLELSSLLNNRMDKVLEDYDPFRCQELYSDDSGCAMSTRSDAVSEKESEYFNWALILRREGGKGGTR